MSTLLKSKMGFDTEVKKINTAVLVAVSTGKQTARQTHEYLDELSFLASTLGIETLQTFTQNLQKPEIRTFVGKGKLQEIEAFVIHKKVECVIFDDDLSPSQLRNLEAQLQVKIYDRSLLILDIFLERAQTAQAKVQVELARNQYLLPRLTNMWTHLERQRGGTGTRGGSGEKEIETDKRDIRDKITLLKERLAKIDKQSITRRKSREEIVRVALVGYTNVGKSTLMNLLAKSEIFAENKLFATVDATVRKVVFNAVPFLLTDTVGFIRKLPHTLVECFKSTLDEIREADLLLHVVDVSHDNFEEQIAVVNQTLIDIKAGNKQTILIFNKIDMFRNDEDVVVFEGENETVETRLENLKRTYMNKSTQKAIFISAVKRENIEELRKEVIAAVKNIHLTIYPNWIKKDWTESL
jgi:GTPase